LPPSNFPDHISLYLLKVLNQSADFPARSRQSKTDPRPDASDGTWRPTLGRQQSWNEQDLKHKFSERLMGSTGVEGIEKGFTTGGKGNGKDT
jgi:hypothetical protein